MGQKNAESDEVVYMQHSARIMGAHLLLRDA